MFLDFQLFLVFEGLGDVLQQKYENLDRKEDPHELHIHHQDFIPKYTFLQHINEKFPE